MKETLFYEGNYYYLSNYAACFVECFGKSWPTAEHAYQAQKFPRNKSIQFRIRRAGSPHAAKQLARMYDRFKDPCWADKKLACMETVLRAKLAQHTFIREGLLSTGNSDIVENSPCDTFWGSGSDWKGQNHLGKIWMKLRSELAECKEEPLREVRYA